MTSKEAKTHIIDTLNGDMNKEYFINELLPEILKDLERLEEIEKAQDLEIGNLKFIDNENKYQVAIRVLKEAFIVLGKSDITNTCWFKYLEELEKENQELKEWCLILNKHLYIAPEMCELRMATPKNADFLIKNGIWTKYYNGIDVYEIDYKKFVDLYYSKIEEVVEYES